jgi:two-component system OmpR family sensor kinase
LKNYERSSFYKIFLAYFISVAIFILLLGFLYFQQHKNIILQQTAMNMHQYLLKLKETNFEYKQDGYSFTKLKLKKVAKQLPKKKNNIYYKAFSNKYVINVDAKIVDEKILQLKYFTIMLQAILILIFLFISYILAKRSLKPMVDTISHMDRFMADLIHDLNTPITSINLNVNMLRKDISESGIKKLDRIENSASNILSLYENLEILLDQKVIEKENLKLDDIVVDLISEYENIYPHIKFIINIPKVNILTNKIAIIRILNNIISNACKYSIDKDPLIEISYRSNCLTIKDNGKGMKYPKKIFERNYTENNAGHGIGMHIVYRLCMLLEHHISIDSKENYGTLIKINF